MGGGGALDIPAAARSVISDWTTCKFRYFVIPPAISSAASMANIEADNAQVVQFLAPSLDIDSLFAGDDATTERATVLGAPSRRGGDDVDSMDSDDDLAPVQVGSAGMQELRALKRHGDIP